MSNSYYYAVISSVGRAETASSDPNAGVFARPDSEVTSTTVTTTTSDPSVGTSETTFFLGELK